MPHGDSVVVGWRKRRKGRKRKSVLCVLDCCGRVQDAHHSPDVLVMYGLLHKQASSSDAVLSFVEEHRTHTLQKGRWRGREYDENKSRFSSFPSVLVTPSPFFSSLSHHAHSLVHVTVAEDDEWRLPSQLQRNLLQVTQRTAATGNDT